MENTRDIINQFLGRIILTKSYFFGLDENKIVIIVTPSLKVARVVSKPKKLADKIPVNIKEILNVDELKSWAQENGYEITFKTDMTDLKRKLFSLFGDVLVESKNNNLSEYVINEVEKSHLPETLKEWVKSNPEKFIDKVKRLND